MLWIVSIILFLIILILSFYVIYGRIYSNSSKHIESKQDVKKVQIETVSGFIKKSKKPKKTMKIANVESDVRHVNDVYNDNVKQKKVSYSDNLVDEQNINENQSVEPVIQVSFQTGCSAAVPDSLDFEKNIDYINKLKELEEEELKLKFKLEEATEKITAFKDEAESLTEENKNMKTKINKLERSKAKIEEQLKKSEKAHSDSLAKTVELEKLLAQFNVDNLDLKRKIELFNQQHIKNDSEFKLEQEKSIQLKVELEDALKKCQEFSEQVNQDNINHIEMYKMYEDKIEQLNSDKKQMKIETINLNSVLHVNGDEIDRLNNELSSTNVKVEELEKQYSQKIKEMSIDLNHKISFINSIETEKTNLINNLNNLQIDSLNETEQLNKKLKEVMEESANKDSAIKELQIDKSHLLTDINDLSKNIKNNDENEMKLMEMISSFDAQHSELEELKSTNFNMTMEIESLREEINHKDTEFEIKLMEMSKELKAKNNDLIDLQDHKFKLLTDIENLKKDRNDIAKEKAIIIDGALKEKDEIIQSLVMANDNMVTKIGHLSTNITDNNNKYTALEYKYSQLCQEFDTKNNDLKQANVEKSQLMMTIDSQPQDNDLNIQQIIMKKDEEIHSIKSICDDLKIKLEKLEKDEDNRIWSNGGNELLNTNDIITQTLQTNVYQEIPITDDGHVVADMQSHIDKLELQLLMMQRKYYELKNTSSHSDESQLLHKGVQINVFPTEAVSIPPVLAADIIVKDIHTDRSQSSNHLLDSIEKLNAEISEQRLKNQDLHVSFVDSSSENKLLQKEYQQLLDKHNSVNAKYESLLNELKILNPASTNENDEAIKLLQIQLIKCQDDNCQLKSQLDQYRETLEKTETYLQNIQTSVDQEENKWKDCLKCSEQEQERLEYKIKELINQIEDLRTKKNSDSSAMISVETPSIANGSLSSETKKKRKRKNKKKKNKNRVTQP